MDFKKKLIKDIVSRIQAITPIPVQNDFIFHDEYSTMEELKSISSFINRIVSHIDDSFHYEIQRELDNESIGRFLRLSFTHALKANNFKLQKQSENTYNLSFQNPFNEKKTIIHFKSEEKTDIDNGSGISDVSFIGSDFNFGVFSFEEEKLNILLTWSIICLKRASS